jgi:hypothetical protein
MKDKNILMPKDEDISLAQEAAYTFINWGNATRFSGKLVDKILVSRQLRKVSLELSKALKHMRNPK